MTAQKKATSVRTSVDPSIFGEDQSKRTVRLDGWSAVDAGTIGTFVQACTACGVACIFTVAQGGNALGVVILNGDEKVKKYFTEPEAMEDFMAATVTKLIASLPQEVRERLKG
jgi:hypothetical protein